ncbi:hypothetical protein BDW59DRAFT_154397 [Aspergillus cavernicola]|uniref:Uncharacterized protein n=1 Tax=Aspergillus cavernicola TaxID=176166 RepID=A0ABR4HG85_9EURO
MITLFKNIQLLIVISLLICSTPVKAGSRLWEPSRPPELINIKWGHFSPLFTGTRPWPNKLIPLCYRNDHMGEAEGRLGPWISAAMELWYAAGLPRDCKVQKASH